MSKFGHNNAGDGHVSRTKETPFDIVSSSPWLNAHSDDVHLTQKLGRDISWGDHVCLDDGSTIEITDIITASGIMLEHDGLAKQAIFMGHGTTTRWLIVHPDETIMMC